MKLLANENFPLKSFRILAASDWDITHIGLECPSIEDEEVIEIAIHENRVILTFDNDYSRLVFLQKMKPPGVVFLRFKDFPSDFPAVFLLNLFRSDEYQFEGKFTVIDSNGNIRQRPIS